MIARELVLLTIAMEHEHDAARPSAPALPERGQVVNVRGASWAVTDVISQSPPRGAARASPGTGAIQDDDEPGVTHVVELQPLEKDQLGTELSVVWELEVRHTVAPDQGLPETIEFGVLIDNRNLTETVERELRNVEDILFDPA